MTDSAPGRDKCACEKHGPARCMVCPRNRGASVAGAQAARLQMLAASPALITPCKVQTTPDHSPRPPRAPSPQHSSHSVRATYRYLLHRNKSSVKAGIFVCFVHCTRSIWYISRHSEHSSPMTSYITFENHVALTHRSRNKSHESLTATILI